MKWPECIKKKSSTKYSPQCGRRYNTLSRHVRTMQGKGKWLKGSFYIYNIRRDALLPHFFFSVCSTRREKKDDEVPQETTAASRKAEWLWKERKLGYDFYVLWLKTMKSKRSVLDWKLKKCLHLTDFLGKDYSLWKMHLGNLILSWDSPSS